MKSLIEIAGQIAVVETQIYSEQLIHKSRVNPSETLTNYYWKRRMDLVNEKSLLLEELDEKLSFEKAIASVEKRDTNLKIA